MDKYKQVIVRGFCFFLFLIVIICIFPNEKDRYPRSKVLYSSNGLLLGARIASDGQWRFPLDINIPKKLEAAVIEFEDKRYYSHMGVDPVAVIRAIKENLGAGRVVSGGSTITQQTIRLMRGIGKRSFFEKIIEAFYALKLNFHFSKKEILRKYLSLAPYGGNIVGIETASWFYFRRQLKDLTWAESALLAILPNNPSIINLRKNRSKLFEKRNNLLRSMRNKEKISLSEFESAKIEPIPSFSGFPDALAPHFLQSSISLFPERNTFHSALDFDIQNQLNEILKLHGDNLSQKRIKNLSVIIIDNSSSEIVGYVGNRSSDNSSGPFVDIARKPRSTGSVLKPLLYMGMLDSGDVNPNMLVFDIPTFYPEFKPVNFDRKFRGAVKASEALSMSLNVPAARMLRYYGVQKFYKYLKTIGLSTLVRDVELYGLSLILGGAEATLFELTKIYSHISQKISKGKSFEVPWLKSEIKKTIRTPYSIGAAYLMSKALTEVNRPEVDGFWKSFKGAQKISWKTGTSNGYKDAWAIGFTPKYTVGVWAGNAYGQGQPDLVGTRAAAPIMFGVFNFLKKSESFYFPGSELKEIEVCEDSGFLANSKCNSIHVYIPKDTIFDRVDSFHEIVHLDKTTGLRANSNCSSLSNLTRKTYFTLPPRVERFYKKVKSSYQTIPRLSPKCLESKSRSEISIIYPEVSTEIYIPRGLDGRKTKVVLEAVHRRSSETLFWHIDENYIGRTKFKHNIAIDLVAGEYKLVVTDSTGEYQERSFSIIAK